MDFKDKIRKQLFQAMEIPWMDKEKGIEGFINIYVSNKGGILPIRTGNSLHVSWLFYKS